MDFVVCRIGVTPVSSSLVEFPLTTVSLMALDFLFFTGIYLALYSSSDSLRFVTGLVSSGITITSLITSKSFSGDNEDFSNFKGQVISCLFSKVSLNSLGRGEASKPESPKPERFSEFSLSSDDSSSKMKYSVSSSKQLSLIIAPEFLALVLFSGLSS